MGRGKKAANANNTSSASENPMGTLGWLWTVFLVSSAMFVLGVLVGRGTAPVAFDIHALQKELAALKAQALEDESKHYRIDAGAGEDQPELDFHEALKSRRPQPEPMTVKKKPRAKVTERASTGSVPPPALKKPAIKAKSPPALDQSRPMTLQVASLRDAAAADKIVDELAARGYPAYRVVAQIPGKGRWHRVRVGSFKDAEAAALTIKKLKEQGKQPILIKRE